MKREIEKYRIETGTIYEYDESARAYLCIGHTSAYTKQELAIMRNEMLTIGEDDEEE